MSVFRPSRLRNGKRVRSAKYRGRYRLPGQPMRDVPLHTTDKRVAEKRLADIIQDAEREAEGIIAPRPLREAVQRSVTDHLAEYMADLERKGRERIYRRLVKARVERLIRECGWQQLQHVTADSFTSWRSRQTSEAPKTLNDYHDAARGFMGWMLRHGRIPTNPLVNIAKVDQRGRQWKRRALTDDELRRLLAVAGRRRLVYLAALHTGLRAGELRALQWSDVHLDAPRPFIRARASTTKSRKDATCWLPTELVTELRANRPVGSSAGRVFRSVPRNDRFRDDLIAAGITYIDHQERRASFHALRVTFCTNLQRAGVTPREAMALMRHSDMRLTAQVYTDVEALPLAAAVDRLPAYLSPAAEPLRATGTHGDSLVDSHDVVTEGHNAARGGTLAVSSDSSETSKMSRVGTVRRAGAEGAKKAGEGIRTLPESALAGSPTGDDSLTDSHDVRSRGRGRFEKQTVAATVDADLGEVVAAWARLTPDERVTVLAVVRATSCNSVQPVTSPPPPSSEGPAAGAIAPRGRRVRGAFERVGAGVTAQSEATAGTRTPRASGGTDGQTTRATRTAGQKGASA